jgi:hypothetical protein
MFSQGFLLRILCCSQSGNHPEINLAKFGYIEFGPFSFMKNPLYKSKSYFSGQNLAKIRQYKKEALCLAMC